MWGIDSGQRTGKEAEGSSLYDMELLSQNWPYFFQ